MKSTFYVSRLIICLSLFLLTTYTAAEITIDGETIHVETDNYKVQFDRGTLTQLHNKITHETYTLPQDSNRTPGFKITAGIVGRRHSFESENARTVKTQKIDSDNVKIIFRQGQNEIRLFIGIDSNTDDLLISGDGISDIPGVIWMQCGIENLDASNLRVIIPAERMQVIDVSSGFKNENFRYPTPHWEAQLAIIEAERGGFYVRGTDTKFKFKNLNYKSDANSFGLGFQTYNQAPWDTLTSANSITWRLNTYAGDWCVPAQIHRDWMEEAFEPWKLSDMPPWVSDIGLVVLYTKLDTKILHKLAELTDPTKTLLYLGGWRKDKHPINYPDYTPHHDFDEFFELARRYGFRIMLHVGIHDCSPDHPLYPKFKKYQYRNPWTNERIGWKWDEIDNPQRNADISPASSEWRNLLVQRFKAVWEKYKPDAFFLDTTHHVINDANGLIEGLTSAQGNVLLHKQLAEAMPGVVFSGEHLHEITFFRESFTRRGLTVGTHHPISAFLFEPYTLVHGGNGTPQTVDPHYYVYLDTAENHGYLPTLRLWSPQAFNDTLFQDILAHARRWQALGLRSNINCDWGPNNLFQYSTQTGETVTHNGSVLVIDNPDLNRDGKVDVLDLIVVANQLGQQVPQATPGDLNGDGIINILDLVRIAQAME